MNEVILRKLQHYCAYQERCHEEVRTKLLSLKIYGNQLEEIINQLIEDDFLNEERYAVAYAGGKYRMKKWGRGKIINELKKRKISEYCIRKAMNEIEDDDYEKTLRKLIVQLRNKYKSPNTFEMNSKVSRYLISRGYEPALIWRYLKSDEDDH